MKCRIDKLKPGMLSASDLFSREGRLLVGKGCEFTEKHKRILKIWGIAEVDIEDGEESEETDGQTPVSYSPEILAKAEQITTYRFRHTDASHPFFRELFQICLLRMAGALADGYRPPDTFGAPPSARLEDMPQILEEDVSPEEFLESKRVELGTIPPVFQELISIINSPRSTSHDIARVVEKDSSLTARLLKIVNSPFYGFPSKIETISRAVTIIGSKQLITLAMGITAIKTFQDVPADLIDMRLFWKHSLQTAFCSRILASNVNLSDSERYFVSGLLHAIGLLVMLKLLPAESSRIMVAARETGELLRTVEGRLLPFTHSDLAGALLRLWNFPVVLEHCVRYHHFPGKSRSHQEQVAVVHVGDVIAGAIDVPDYVSSPVHPLSVPAWESLGLSVMTLQPLVEQVDFLYNQTAGFFLKDE
jgi:HD-like signal output (HDOD) protein